MVHQTIYHLMKNIHVMVIAITNPYGKSKYICEHSLKDTAVAHPVRILFLKLNQFLII